MKFRHSVSQAVAVIKNTFEHVFVVDRMNFIAADKQIENTNRKHLAAQGRERSLVEFMQIRIQSALVNLRKTALDFRAVGQIEMLDGFGKQARFKPTTTDAPSANPHCSRFS